MSNLENKRLPFNFEVFVARIILKIKFNMKVFLSGMSKEEYMRKEEQEAWEWYEEFKKTDEYKSYLAQ